MHKSLVAKPSIAFQVFGCRLNQAEAEGWQHALIREGYPIVSPKEADVLCVHSCAVTEPAVREVAKLLRHLQRTRPLQRIILSGCATRLVEGITPHLSIAHEVKVEWLPRVLNYLSELSTPPTTILTTSAPHRTRASLIIQDGCDQFCAYCIVPYLRGTPVSEPSDDLIHRASQLFAEGYPEIVLTGCHLALYKDPLTGGNFIDLLKRLCDIPGEGRFRIGSLEPCILDDVELIRLIAQSGGRICNFLHLPIQSADDDLLRRMGRRYTQTDVRRVLDTLCETLPNCGLSADWIAGLPGETEMAFEQTAKFIAAYPFTGAHVFPYSKRAGTPAATFPDQVPQAEIIRRAKVLRDLAHSQQRQQLQRQIGQPLQVIPEQAQGDVRYGWSSERFHVRLPASYPRGKCISVSPSRLENDTLIVTE